MRMSSSLSYSPPSRHEALVMVCCLLLWLGVTVFFVGWRPEHALMGLLIAALFFASSASRKFVVALLPFALFGISYDWMNLCPNYTVNPVDIGGIYEAEKSLFGIMGAEGNILTPNEFFAIHNWKIMDFMAGVFYLCWVPVPILFGIWLYGDRQRKVYLHFAVVFLLVNLIGFAGYYIHPAAPPWYVMHYGFDFIPGTGGETAGLSRFGDITGWHVFDALYGRNANVFAAVPSLHSAYMVVALWYAFKAKCPALIRVLFAVILVGIWFTAVYTAHHYLIDVLLGIATALGGIILFEYGLMRIKCVKDFMHQYLKYIS